MNQGFKEDTSWVELSKEKSQNFSNELCEESKSNESLDIIKRNLDSHYSPMNNFDIESNNTSIFAPTKATNIFCKLHAKEYLIVDLVKFKVHCKKCVETGDKNKNLKTKDSDSDEDSDSDIECSNHPKVKGLFYCDDCHEFLCKLCFANKHRMHKSNLPLEIANSYKDKLKAIIDSISQMKPKIDESLKSISEVDKKIKLIRETSNNSVKVLFNKINSIVKSKCEKNVSQYETLFEGMDLEVENVYKRLESLQKRSAKYIYDVNEIIRSLDSNSFKENHDLCAYKKDKQSLMADILKMLEDSKNFLNFKIESTKTKANLKLKHFESLTDKFLKQISMYEKSVVNSINTGISSSSLRLRRYCKFSKKIYQYYKRSSIVCKVNSRICLVGLGLCGLLEGKAPDQLKEKDNYVNIITQKMKLSIPIQIEVFEVKNDEKQKDYLIKELHSLIPIVNSNDPTIVLYFNKALHMKPEANYILTVTNLYKESFLEIWCGEVAKVFQKNLIQSIFCNTSGVNFNFSAAEGFESDFNEFNSGIIADLIYSVVG